MKIALALFVLIPALAAAQTKVLVTVVESKTGKPVTDLKASDFALLEGKTPRPIHSAEFTTGTVDIMLLLDTSLAGGMVQSLADDLIAQLGAKEQMAIVSFHSSADLIQDFTSSKELLNRAIYSVKYGNEPSVLNALYAAIDGGFQSTTYRRVALLLTTGVEGAGRVSEQQVVKLARRNGVSIYPVYVIGYERSLFESLARQTGGASFSLRDLRKESEKVIGTRIFEVLRSHYSLSVGGNLALAEKISVQVKRPGKLVVSALPLD